MMLMMVILITMSKVRASRASTWECWWSRQGAEEDRSPRRLCSTSPLLPRERNLPREATNSPTVNTRDGKHTCCPLIWSSISWPWEEGEIITEPFHINSLNVIIWGFLIIQKFSHCHSMRSLDHWCVCRLPIIVIVIVICNCNANYSFEDTPRSLQNPLSKNKSNCIVSYSFSTIFSYYEQEVCQSSRWKVCLGPMRSFLSGWMVVISFNFLLQSSEFYWPFGVFLLIT